MCAPSPPKEPRLAALVGVAALVVLAEEAAERSASIHLP
jgi:hypothetical protein